MGLDKQTQGITKKAEHGSNEVPNRPEQEGVRLNVLQEKILHFAREMRSESKNVSRIREFLKRETGTDVPDITSTFKSVFELAREHPDYGQELYEIGQYFGNWANMITPEDLMGMVAEFSWDPRINGNLRDELTRTIAYSFDGPSFQHTMLDYLDFMHPEHFSRTSHVLEFMRHLYNEADVFKTPDHPIVSELRGRLEEAQKNQAGSYLLHMRAQQLHDEMDGQFYIWAGNDRVPFIMAHGSWAYPKEDGLYLVEPENANQVRRAIDDFEDAERQLIARGNRMLRRSDPLVRQRDASHKLFGKLATHRIGVEDVQLPNDNLATEETLHEYAYLMSLPVRTIIEKDFGANVTKLSIREQFRFLQFLKTVDLAYAQQVQEFTKAHGESGLRTFLVTAEDETLRNQVFEFAQAVGKEKAQEVFDVYGTLVERIDSVGDYLHENFGKDDTNSVDLIVQQLLKRARGTLEQAHVYQNDPEKLSELAHSVDADTQLFILACRRLKKEGKLRLEEVRGAQLESISGNQLSDGDRGIMLKIQEVQYADKYSETARAELRASLEHALSNPTTKFYLYRKDGEIITYVRFDETATNDNASKHMGSFMTNPKFEGGALGQAMLEVALQKELESGMPIKAECDPSLVPFYHRFGFDPVGSEYIDELGIPTYDIILLPNAGDQSLREAA